MKKEIEQIERKDKMNDNENKTNASIKAPVSYKINDPYGFAFATYYEADGKHIPPERLIAALNEADTLRARVEGYRDLADWLEVWQKKVENETRRTVFSPEMDEKIKQLRNGAANTAATPAAIFKTALVNIGQRAALTRCEHPDLTLIFETATTALLVDRFLQKTAAIKPNAAAGGEKQDGK